MISDYKDGYTLGDIIRHTEGLLRFLVRKRWYLLLSIIAGAVIGAIYTYYQPPHFNAELVFLVDDRNTNATTEPNSQVSVQLNNLLNPGAGLGNDNILSYFTAKKIVVGQLLSPVDTGNPQTLAELYIGMHNYRAKWNDDPELKTLQFVVNQPTTTPVQDSILTDLYDKVVDRNIDIERISNKTSVFKLSVTSTSNAFSYQMASGIFDAAATAYKTAKTSAVTRVIHELEQTGGDSSAQRIILLKRQIAQQEPLVEVLTHPARRLEDKRKTYVFLMLAFAVGALFLYVLYAFLYYITRYQSSN